MAEPDKERTERLRQMLEASIMQGHALAKTVGDGSLTPQEHSGEKQDMSMLPYVVQLGAVAETGPQTSREKKL